MNPNDTELPITSSKVEVAGFFALSLVSRKRAFSAFLDYHRLTTVNVARAIAKHPSRVSQVVYSESAPEEVIEGLRTKVGVLDFLLPKPTDKNRAA